MPTEQDTYETTVTTLTTIVMIIKMMVCKSKPNTTTEKILMVMMRNMVQIHDE